MLMRGEQSSDVEFLLSREDVQRAHRRVEAADDPPGASRREVRDE
ncbi:hypothetical protein Q427_31120 [Halomonas sp. BC04]|nr:hypothetical protein Q427_31120 [Halomonas sp. BC04]